MAGAGGVHELVVERGRVVFGGEEGAERRHGDDVARGNVAGDVARDDAGDAEAQNPALVRADGRRRGRRVRGAACVHVRTPGWVGRRAKGCDDVCSEFHILPESRAASCSRARGRLWLSVFDVADSRVSVPHPVSRVCGIEHPAPGRAKNTSTVNGSRRTPWADDESPRVHDIVLAALMRSAWRAWRLRRRRARRL